MRDLTISHRSVPMDQIGQQALVELSVRVIEVLQFAASVTVSRLS